jgi:uncharacterized protein (DUF1499 family)
MIAGLVLLGLIAGLLAGALITNGPSWNEPPGALQRLRTYLGTNVATTEDSPLPELAPRRYSLSGEQTLKAIRHALAELNWVESPRDAERNEIHAVVTTPLWRFKDDLRIWVEEEEGASVIHACSRSRIGRGDLGANRRHLLDLFATIDRITASEQGR